MKLTIEKKLYVDYLVSSQLEKYGVSLDSKYIIQDMKMSSENDLYNDKVKGLNEKKLDKDCSCNF